MRIAFSLTSLIVLLSGVIHLFFSTNATRLPGDDEPRVIEMALSNAVLITRSLTISEPLAVSTTLYLPHLVESEQLYFPLLSFAMPSWLTQPLPADAAEEQSPNVNLLWTDETGIVGPRQYEIHLQADKADATAWVSLTDKPQIDPPTLAVATTYRWQVTAIDSQGQRWAGPTWRFTTEGPFTPNKVGTMIAIPAGEFLMGCDPKNASLPKTCWARETPLHAVYLDAYTIDKYEVTNQQYRTCVQAEACDPPQHPKSRKRNDYYTNATYNDYPVLYVSWWNAQDYCSWQDKRLPTEAEWEKAARGTIDTRPWPWGTEFPDCTRLNFTNNYGGQWLACVDDTVQVGSYPTGASPYGVMDMGGNAFEWVADLYDTEYYKRSPYMNPTGPTKTADGNDRPLFVVRGGSYRPNWFYPQVNHRHWGHHGDDPPANDAPYYRNDQVGFRCARSVE